jgi:hypothetical protein
VPAEGDKVVIEVTKFAKILVSEDGTSVTIRNKSISAGDIITIDSFSNHDILGIETRVFVGGQTYTTEIPVGFDQAAFDQGPQSYYAGVDPDSAVYDPLDAPAITPTVGFDTNGSTTLVIAKFDLERTYANMNYMWVTIAGRRLMPVRDFVVEGQYLYISPKFVVTDDVTIAVTTFAQEVQTEVISYRQFKDITGNTEYLRMSLNATTTLLANLSITDTTVLVEDPSKLAVPGIKSAIPGVVFINGERITYFRNYATEVITPWVAGTNYDLQTLVSYEDVVYDVIGDVNGAAFEDILGNLVELPSTVVTHGLGQIRRGSGGTGATEHTAGDLVVDGSAQQLVPDSTDQYSVALFTDTDGKSVDFTTTVPNPLTPDVTTILYLTQEQKDDIELKVENVANYYAEVRPDETPPYTTLGEFVKTMITVYVGGTAITADEFDVVLDATTYNGDDVYCFVVTLAQAPAASVWVAIELRISGVWFDVGVVDQIINVTDVEPGKTYQVATIGDTDFTAIGASGNVVGAQFVASSAGSGTGTVIFNVTSGLAMSTTNQAKFLKEEPGFLL